MHGWMHGLEKGSPIAHPLRKDRFDLIVHAGFLFLRGSVQGVARFNGNVSGVDVASFRFSTLKPLSIGIL